MEGIKKTYEQIKKGYGEPREGFDEYLKKCEIVPIPTAVPDMCSYYKISEGDILHSIMVQPFYDSRTMKARPTDILVVSFPKTGTTWTQEITYLIVHNADFEKAKSAPTEVRFPFIEIPSCGIKGIENFDDPRTIKSHLPYDFLPQDFIDKKTKMIYIVRNPKDTVVSFYHFLKMIGYVGFNGTLDEFVDLFCSNRIMYSSFARNALSFWNRRNEDNILFLFYEDLQKDLKSNVEKMAKFLEKSLTNEQIDKIVEHATFDNMKKNPMANYSHGGAAVKMPDSKTEFLRKGKTADWKNHLTAEQSAKIDAYVDKYFAGSGLKFTYEV